MESIVCATTVAAAGANASSFPEQWVRFFFDRPEPPQTDNLVNYFFDVDLREEYTFFDAHDPDR